MATIEQKRCFLNASWARPSAIRLSDEHLSVLASAEKKDCGGDGAGRVLESGLAGDGCRKA